MERESGRAKEGRIEFGGLESISDPKFRTYIDTGVAGMVTSTRKDGYVRVLKSIEPVMHFFPYTQLYRNEDREVRVAAKLNNLQRLGFVTMELSINESGAKNVTKITPVDDMVLGLSYLYGVNGIIDRNIEKKKQMSTALQTVRPYWTGHPMGERIEDILNKIPGVREKFLSEAKGGYEEAKDREGKPSYKHDFRGMIPSLEPSELNENVSDLVKIFKNFKEAAVARKLYDWNALVASSTTEAIRFISAVNDAREGDFVAYDSNYSPRDFLRDINRVGKNMLELEEKMKERGVDCNLTLGTVFELKKKTAERRNAQR